MSVASVSQLRPWLGLASFTEANAAQFFGREAEVAELVRRLSRKGLTVLFGQSGLGKTSMLQAGVVPRLRERGFAPVLLRMDYAAESTAPGAQMLAALGWPQDEGLWEQLHRRDREGAAPLLIFDQFEEVFTLGQADEAGRAKAQAFLAELADLIENRVPAALEARLEDDDSLFDRYDLQRADYRLLISLREDYLADLEPLKSAMPGITQNRMRIAPMTGEQALQAVCGPGGELVSTETAEAIVCFVSGARSLPQAQVEPALLSLILRELNEQRIAKGQAQITTDLLAGSHAAILSDFYERSLADQPAGVRHFIEDQLLTDTGYRENVAEERVQQAFAAAGAAPDALDQLVNRRLLRVEERLDRRRVELTHDTLCAVVAASRDNRRERERAEAAERQATEQQAHAKAARRAVLRARWVASISATLGLLAIAASGLAYRYFALANEARGNSQALTAYLLEDLSAELEYSGRFDIVIQVAQRAIDYYQALPSTLRNDDSEHREALARIQKGAALIRQFRVAEGKAEVEPALRRLQALAQHHPQDSDLRYSQVQAVQALTQAAFIDWEVGVTLSRTQAALLTPAAAPRSPREIDIRMLSAWHTAIAALNNGDGPAGLQASRDFMALAQAHGGGPGGQNVLVTARVLDSSSILMIIFKRSASQEEFQDLRRQLLERAEWLQGRQPDHRAALGFRGHDAAMRGQDLYNAHHNQAAIEQFDVAIAAFGRMADRDPNDGYVVTNIAKALRARASAQQALGQLTQALESLQRSDRLAAKLPEAAFGLAERVEARFHLNFLEMELGGGTEVLAALPELRAIAARLPGVDGLLATNRVEEREAAVALRQGRALDAERIAHAAWQKLQSALPPLSDLSPQDRRGLQRAEMYLHRLLCETSMKRGAVTRAVAECQAALDLQLALGDEDRWLDMRIWLALTQARAGQRDGAATTLAPAIRFYEDLARQTHDDEEMRLMHARVLLVQALVDPDKRRDHLLRARAIHDGLPHDIHRVYNYRTWNDWINEELAKPSALRPWPGMASD